jgi:hypothetical protein
MPPPSPPERSALVERIAAHIASLGPARLRVAIDGLTAAGKTSLGHELAERIRAAGRPVLRASLDDFKKPWREAHLYDRASGEGYYRNAFDYTAIKTLLLEPCGPARFGTVRPMQHRSADPARPLIGRRPGTTGRRTHRRWSLRFPPADQRALGSADLAGCGPGAVDSAGHRTRSGPGGHRSRSFASRPVSAGRTSLHSRGRPGQAGRGRHRQHRVRSTQNRPTPMIGAQRAPLRLRHGHLSLVVAN